MRKRLFRSTLLVCCTLLLILSTAFTMSLYAAEKRQLTQALSEETGLLAAALSHTDSREALFAVLPQERRATLIDASGIVLYDTSAAAANMDNHSDRTEFILAKKDGSATVTRASATLSEEMVYHTELLEDGSVLRLAAAQKTLIGGVLISLPYMLLAILGCVLLAALLSAGSTKRLAAPILAIDPEHPLDTDCYDELTPLLRNLHRQQEVANAQMEKLRAQKTEQDELLSNMREGLCILDKSDRVVTLNEAARQLLMIEDADYSGKQLLALIRSSDLQQLASQSREKGSAQGAYVSAGRHYHVTVSRIGQNEGTLMLFLDDSADMEAEEMRRQFTANVSHELRTPLTAINGYAELMDAGLVKSEDCAEFVRRIHRESTRMLSLVEDILRLSQLDEGSIRLNSGSIDMKAFLTDIKSSLAQKAESRNIAINIDTEQDMKFRTDPTLFQEIVYNLADNAVKYGREGGSTEISARRDGSRLCLVVQDDGIGIPPEHQKKIFERFYRVDKSRSKATGGTGLGLSIVKHACIMLGGEISLQSAEGMGTTVMVLLPELPLHVC